MARKLADRQKKLVMECTFYQSSLRYVLVLVPSDPLA
ncbi:hypothetical protein RDI58_027215 [Solanum bulbocastanum]|uniref:Uncharacterized protein n=1 Tax=Solanum bulbocastanum TaxID=147425 RepID=A0AAN8Y1X2_SOLBU